MEKELFAAWLHFIHLLEVKSFKVNGKVYLNNKNFIIKVGNNCWPKNKQWRQKLRLLRILRDIYMRIHLLRCICRLDLMLSLKLFSSSIRINMAWFQQNQDQECAMATIGSNFLTLFHQYVKPLQNLKMLILLVFHSTQWSLICLIPNMEGSSSASLRLIITSRLYSIPMVRCLTLQNH